MKRIVFIVVIALVTLTSCKERRNSNQAEVAPPSSKYDRFIVDTILPGIKNQVTYRGIDNQNPPKTLDFSKPMSSYPKAELDLSKYFTTVECQIFSHPDAASGKKFYKSQSRHISYDRGASSGGFSSNISRTQKGFLVGDDMNGLFLYDKNGTIVDTVVLNDVPFKEIKDWGGKDAIEIQGKNLKGFAGLSNIDGDEIIYTYKDTLGNYEQRWYDLEKKEVVLKRILKRNVPDAGLRLNDSVYLAAAYDFLNDSKIFLQLMNVYGDTLSVFKNPSAEKVVLDRSYNRPEQPDIYKYENKLHFRRSYNDTLYTLNGIDRLTAKYVINLGKNRVDPETGMLGDKKEKLMPVKWIETKDFILYTFTQNIDVPNTRANSSVKYFVMMYDKASEAIYHLNSKVNYPSDFLVSNKVSGGIPFLMSEIVYVSKSNHFRAIYDKKTLKKIIDHPDFSKLPKEQKDKTIEQHDKLNEGELLYMEIR